MPRSPFTFGMDGIEMNNVKKLLHRRSPLSATVLAISMTVGPSLVPLPAFSVPNRQSQITAPEPRVSRSNAASPVPANLPGEHPLTSSVPRFTAEQISYFLDVAMGAEFSAAPARIHKWRGDVRIQYLGNPTETDLDTLRAVIAEVNQLTQGEINLSLVNETPNVTVRFVPESQFSNYEPNYQSTNYGFFWTWWNNHVINQANILIATDSLITSQERSHLIREELTQSLGLMQDSRRYPNSLFFQDWTATTQYSDMDKALIRMLYQPTVKAGMTRAEVIAALQASPRSQTSQLPNWTNNSPLKF
jgi:hypothetical protein